MTLLIASIAPHTEDELTKCIHRAQASGCDAIEVRLDHFGDAVSAITTAINHTSKPVWILTCRSGEEGGATQDDDATRARKIAQAIGSNRACVDFEWKDWQRSDEVRSILQDALSNNRDERERLILSAHQLGSPQSNVDELAASIVDSEQAGVAKIAVCTDEITDSFVILDLLHRYGPRVIAIAMGEAGQWTRVLAAKFGAWGTFAALDVGQQTAAGQFTVDDMLLRYRWRNINTSTRVFGVLGDPVAHSMGPTIFNHWFAEHDINAVYLPLRVSAENGCLARFLDGCKARSWLDVGGFSVTIPHKANALRWVGEGADSCAQSIGALNTISFRDGQTRGYNTDCYAAVASLVSALGCERGELSNVSVGVLGSGGASAAICEGLTSAGCHLTVFGRNAMTTRSMAEHFQCNSGAWNDRAEMKCDVLINTTPVGMWPAVDESPMPADSLSHFRLVFDLIYNPTRTKLLSDAQTAGVAILNGLDMFLRQAATQFELWTNVQPSLDSARTLIQASLQSQEHKAQ